MLARHFFNLSNQSIRALTPKQTSLPRVSLSHLILETCFFFARENFPSQDGKSIRRTIQSAFLPFSFTRSCPSSFSFQQSHHMCVPMSLVVLLIGGERYSQPLPFAKCLYDPKVVKLKMDYCRCWGFRRKKKCHSD